MEKIFRLTVSDRCTYTNYSFIAFMFYVIKKKISSIKRKFIYVENVYCTYIHKVEN